MEANECEDVTARLEGRTWAAGLLAAAVVLAPASAVWAEERLAAGTKDVGLGGAISISHDTRDGLDTLTGVQLLPHVGYVVTDTLGSDWLRGNIELLLEPTLLYLKDEGHSATTIGTSALARWIFSGAGRLRPYVEAGAGVLIGETDLRQTDCEVNFIFQGGPGLLVFLSDTTTLTVAYRLQHISNGGACSFNVGINSSALYLGVNYLFR
jgi:opacity protein-like surface antigen